MSVRFFIWLTVFATGCATSRPVTFSDTLTSAVVRQREAYQAKLDFIRLAQLQEFLGARNWRPYHVTLPAGYTGIDLELLTRSGERTGLSVYRHGDHGSLFLHRSKETLAATLSSEEMIRFMAILRTEPPSNVPTPTPDL